MNVLLIGGSGSLINSLIIKFKKEGHRVYLLTGTRQDKAPYQKVFERYNFPYDCACLNEIFESINMDLTIFLGAYDTNFKWTNEEADAVQYSSGLMNILMSYAMKNKGRFVYLSSDEVYSINSESDITENDPLTPMGVKSMLLAQAEEMCESYRVSRERDIMTLRLDHVYGVPKKRSECRDKCTRMCLEAFDEKKITANENSKFALLYETDAVEFIYRASVADSHEYSLYNISSCREKTEPEVAEMIRPHFGDETKVMSLPGEKKRIVLSNERFVSEFGKQYYCNDEGIIKNIARTMNLNKNAFWNDEEKKKSLAERVVDKGGWLIKALIPFIENLIVFIPFFLLNNKTADSKYFANLDFYLLYVLLFAIVYGQQQAVFSAVLATVGYCFRQMYTQTGFEILLDTNTYVWIAQIFILGLVVGYMRDQITKLKRESLEEKEFLSGQLGDMRDINSSNVRVKDALETQLVNQNDSIGKIYSITSALDQRSPEEVLFYAADMLSTLVKSKDVAIYNVVNDDYARLFSATSKKARVLGNSVKYRVQLSSMYEVLEDHKVFINRKMEDGLPMMANMIFDDDNRPQTILMIWTLPWENMTLGQANILVVISALIKGAVVRSTRYLQALQEKRYIEGTKVLEADAFIPLRTAFQNAEREGLAECVLLSVKAQKDDTVYTLSNKVAHLLRQSDIMGMTDEGLQILLANTTRADSAFVMKRFENQGIDTEIVEDGVVCLRPDRVS
ncbi:MAG: NAD(P)-dependent oxidoreductase [Lachnospiraceae bacterium]|nr:NAD(P)-dependent oxidoreductase [Lachnospiraceae bacterium]